MMSCKTRLINKIAPSAVPGHADPVLGGDGDGRREGHLEQALPHLRSALYGVVHFSVANYCPYLTSHSTV